MNDLALANASQGPARPEKLTVDFYEEADAIAIHKKGGGGPAGFLLLWLIGWTVACVVLAVMFIKDPSLGNLAFAVPFWASWLFVAGLLVWLLFGKETLIVRQDKALFLRTAWITLSTRGVPREEIQGFRQCRSKHLENDEHLWGIEMTTLGKPVRFAFRLPDRERAWLIYRLNQFVGKSQPEVEQVEPPSALELARQRAFSGPSPETSTSHEVLTVDNTLARPPTDCDWQFTDDISAIAFSQRGRLEFTTLLWLLFLNAFWNGIVSVFVLSMLGLSPLDQVPQGWEWWGMFVFLIPFEVIGLAFFAALVITIFEPFCRRKWRFEPDRIVRQVRYSLFGRTRGWGVLGLDRLELRRSGGRYNQLKAITDTSPQSSDTSYELAFVTADNVDLCSVPNLTEGEARWMANAVLERRPRWFEK